MTTIREEVTFPDPNTPDSRSCGSGDAVAADADHYIVTMPPSIKDSDMRHTKQYLNDTKPPGFSHAAVDMVSHFSDTDATELKQSYADSEYIEMDHLQPGSTSEGHCPLLTEHQFPLEPHVIIGPPISSVPSADPIPTATGANPTPTTPTGADPPPTASTELIT